MTMSPTREFWESQLEAYGARPEDLVVLDDQANPTDAIRYLDLVRGAESGMPSLWPKAVVEVGGQPVLYVVDKRDIRRLGSESLPMLRRALAFRAGADHVAVSEPGRLTVYPVAPNSIRSLREQTKTIEGGDASLIPSLAFPPLEASYRRNARSSSSTAVAVHKLLYDLLTSAISELTNAGVGHLDALSLVGRALFVRFLVDRKVLSDGELVAISGARTEGCFATPRHAATMCRWLDDTFNGDFLPLPNKGSLRWFNGLPGIVYDELGKVVQRTTSSGQQHLTWGNDWDDLLFDHIPVGILSQVYEHHAHEFDPLLANITSVRYTPRHIAEYMVDEVFFAIGDRAHEARVLDPAVGGGVFLVAAFRRLAAERWRADGRPPNTKKLRKILYQQLRGFDISLPALRLSSLGLYLTAIELDPAPSPRNGLKFDKPLLGTVLYDTSSHNTRYTFIGSLDPEQVGLEHQGKYDVVIGNPPWKSWAKAPNVPQEDIDAQIACVERTVLDIVQKRTVDAHLSKYSMVDHVPDLPFLWRAMEWSKEGGHIAFALHARVLFKQSDAGRISRHQIFDALAISGILDGSALRDTDYWPDVRAQFCLLFAKNIRPERGSSFWFVSPELEKMLNDHGRLRVDDGSAVPVATEELSGHPWLLKALSRGTVLDLRVLERIAQVASGTLFEYWDRMGWRKRRGQGFKIGGGTYRKVPARELWGLPSLSRTTSWPFRIEPLRLELPLVETDLAMQRPRPRVLYQNPLVLVGESPPVDRSSPAAHLCFSDVAFSQSYTGFSCAAHENAENLARYLFLLLNSNMVAFHALMTSGRFGVERDALLVEDVGRIPFRPLEDLSPSLTKELEAMSDALVQRGANVLDDVDQLIAEVYGLSRSDCDVIRDTLQVGPPFASTRIRAQSRPTSTEVAEYGAHLREILLPFVGRHGRTLTLRVLRNDPHEPWLVLQLDSYMTGAALPDMYVDSALADLVEAADSLAATRVVAVHPPSTLLLGVVAQYRYLTPSRARLLGLDLLQEHAGILLGREGVEQ